MTRSTSPTLRAVFYLRLSVAGSEESTSLTRQEADLRSEAERRGWDVVRRLTDDGISGGKARDNAETAETIQRMSDASASSGTTNLGALLKAKLDQQRNDG